MCSMVPRLATILVLCIHLLHISSGQLESTGESEIGTRYCGRYLVKALQVVCNGLPNNLIYKRSTDDLIPPEVVQSDSSSEFLLQDADDEAMMYPLEAKSSETDLKSRSFRRVTRGIHEECCLKGCTFQQMSSYCSRK